MATSRGSRCRVPIIAQADFAHLITRQMRSLRSLSNRFNSWRASYISWLSIYHSSEGSWTPEQNAARKGLEATLHIACRFRVACSPLSETQCITALCEKKGSRAHATRGCRDAKGYASRNERSTGQQMQCGMSSALYGLYCLVFT